MNLLSRYINLGTNHLTDLKKIETVRLFNALAMVGMLIHLSVFLVFFVVELSNTVVTSAVVLLGASHRALDPVRTGCRHPPGLPLPFL